MMNKTTGFMEIDRALPEKRPVAERVLDWRELYHPFSEDKLRQQATRCMDCGVPFCHDGCTLHNYIPSWNDLVYRGRWKEALQSLHGTNNFPEITGRVCPALCEASCVAGLGGDAVTIREIEKNIAEIGFDRGWVTPYAAQVKTGKRAAVIGSGPAGLAVAQQLTRAGHKVVLFEKNERPGGLLRFGIPDFKLEKWILDRRLDQMISEGLTVKTGVHVGVDLSVQELRRAFDAICLAGGSETPRDLSVPGRSLRGIHFAMDFLSQQNRQEAGLKIPETERILATGKRVVVIGGGDTGADCVGSSIRQGAVSVTQIELLPKPPPHRSSETPWPLWPHLLQTSTSHEEGCERLWSVLTKRFEGDGGENGTIKQLHAVRLRWCEKQEGARPSMEEIQGSHFVLKAELVLLAMGFLHPVRQGMLEDLGVELDLDGNVRTDDNQMTSVEGVFAAGDMATGQSLVLKAIHGGRQAAQAMDRWLRDGCSVLS